VPLSGLLDPAFAATRRCLIGNTALVSPVAPGPFRLTDCPAQCAQQPPRRAATPTTSSPPTVGRRRAFTNRSTSSAAPARPCRATASCSTTR
jgi:hypothetical protein